MANIKSAKKRIKTIDRQNSENRLVKSTMATYIKKFKALLKANELDKAEVQLKETISYIDTAVAKGIIHKNNGSRKVSRLSAAFDSAKKKVVTTKVEKKVEEVIPAPVVEKEVVAEVKETKTTKAKKVVEKKEKPAKVEKEAKTKKTK